MWVLSAREDAEKVWYSYVWEETKDASNVIDYDIREEQTIQSSSVFNANNDTTTGMANVIPWINAPKLLYSTSIIWKWWWGWEYAVWTWACADNRVWAWTDEDVLPEWTITLTDYTDWKFIISGNEMTIVEWGTYLFNIEQTNFIRSSQTTDYYIRTIVEIDWTAVIDGRVYYWPTPFTRNWPLSIPAWWVMKVYWMLWHVSSALAPSWWWVEWNLSLVRVW